MKRLVIFLFLVCAVSSLIFAEEAVNATNGAEAAMSSTIWRYIAAALAVGISCIAGGVAVARIGTAAMGAMSENPEVAGKALPFAGLAEGICLWGFLVALLILVV